MAVDAADRSDSTALAYAINEGHADVVRRLLAAGADPDQVTVYPAAGKRLTALVRALVRGHEDMVAQLLAAGARVEADMDRLPRLSEAVKARLVALRAKQVGRTQLSSQVLRQIRRLGGELRPDSPRRSLEHRGVAAPEPIRAFVRDVRWPEVRYCGEDGVVYISWLKFCALDLSEGPEIGIGESLGGHAWLVLRLDSPDPTDPLVFRRDAEDGTDSGQVALSRLLASLEVDERSVNRRSE